MRTHYLHSYRLALASGFVHFAGAIACLYFAEFGECLPDLAAETPYAHPTGKL